MSFCLVATSPFSEWGWLFGFALASLALVALAVLADALYEGYRARVHQVRHSRPETAREGEARSGTSHLEKPSTPKGKAA